MKKSSLWPSIAIVMLGSFSAASLAQDICTQTNPSLSLNHYNFIQLTGDSHPALFTASGMWNTACDSMVPYFNTTSSQPMSLNISINLSSSPVSNPCGLSVCGCTSMQVTSGGDVVGGSVWVFENKSDGSSCGDYAQVIAHELGHVLGFNDVSAICLGRIMYGVFPAPSAAPGIAECSAANLIWYTDWESPDPCDWPDTSDQFCGNQGQSPIVLDLDRNGFHLAGLEDSVLFDLDANGTPERISWTSGESLDAFLWLDRNENGFVDDGSELFGTSTRLLDGSLAPNGFVALAEFDAYHLGGNSDGYIDSSDDVFSELRLWVDTDHDGVSDSSEIFALSEMDVVRLDWHYRRSVRRDQHGNLFRYTSRCWVASRDQSRLIHTVDVFFVLGE